MKGQTPVAMAIVKPLTVIADDGGGFKAMVMAMSQAIRQRRPWR